MSSEPYHCNVCGQYVIYHLGLEKVMNYTDGFGGKKGDPHTHTGDRKGIECNRCGLKYDPEIYYQCYNCFRQVCQKCGYMFIWSHKQNTCSRCKDIRSKMITLTVFDPEKKKYVKKDSPFINYEIMQILEELEEIEKINNTK